MTDTPEVANLPATTKQQPTPKIERFERWIIEELGGKLARVMPRHFTPERVAQLALLAATNNPALLECTAASLAQAIIKASSWGLDIGESVHLLVIESGARSGKPTKKVAIPVPDYRGLVAMAKRAGIVRDITPLCRL